MNTHSADDLGHAYNSFHCRFLYLVRGIVVDCDKLIDNKWNKAFFLKQW